MKIESRMQWLRTLLAMVTQAIFAFVLKTSAAPIFMLSIATILPKESLWKRKVIPLVEIRLWLSRVRGASLFQE